MVCSRSGFQETLDSALADRLLHLSDGRDEQPQHTSENKIEDDVLRVPLACHYASNNSNKLEGSYHTDAYGSMHIPPSVLLQRQEGSAKHILYGINDKRRKYYLDTISIFPTNSDTFAMHTSICNIIQGSKRNRNGYRATLLDFDSIFRI